MQRLFTTFANGWPGFGLLIQRLIIGACLLHTGLGSVTEGHISGLIALESFSGILGLFILAGLWTPVAGVLAAGAEFLIMVMGSDDIWMSLMLAVFGCTLAMIGPGAWSIDARLFGRKRIEH